MVKSFTRPIHLATRSTICQVIRQRRFVGFIDDSATRHLLEFWKRRRGFSWWWVYQSKSQNARTKTTYTAHEHQDLYCHLYFTSIIFTNQKVKNPRGPEPESVQDLEPEWMLQPLQTVKSLMMKEPECCKELEPRWHKEPVPESVQVRVQETSRSLCTSA